MAKAKSKPVKLEKVSKSLIKIKKPNIKFKFTKPDFSKYKRFKKPVLTALVVLISFILVDFLVQYLNNDYSVAVVNGSRISRSTYNAKLESMYGQSIAQQLIDEEIVKQEASKVGVEATEEEVQERLDDIILSIGGQERYEEVLKANNFTEQELKDQIKLDIITKEILEPSIEYTDDDIKAYFDQNSAIIFPNETAALEDGEKLNYELYREEIKEFFIQQKVENQRHIWIEGLYAEYRIQNNVIEKPKYGVLTTTINIFRNLFNTVNNNQE